MKYNYDAILFHFDEVLRDGGFQETVKRIRLSDLDPGAVRFIGELKNRKIKTALCSGLEIEASELNELFDVIITGKENQKNQPHPEIFQQAAKNLGVHNVNCLVFGTASLALQAAITSKMRCIGIGPSANLPEVEETVANFDEIEIDELLESGRLKHILVDPWQIVETEVNPKRSAYWESLFSLSNGYLGIRGTYDEEHQQVLPHSRQGMYINSIYDYLKSWNHVYNFKGLPQRIHTMINLWDWTIINLEVDGEKFNFFLGKITDYRRELDLKNGVLNRSLIWESPTGKKLEIRSTRMASMVRRHSAVIHYTVKPLNFSGNIVFESLLKGKAVNPDYSFEPLEQLESGIRENLHYTLSETKNSRFKVIMAVGHHLNKTDYLTNIDIKGDDLAIRFQVRVSAGELVTLDKHACFYTSIEEPEDKLISIALNVVAKDIQDGYSQMYSEQSRFWSDHWEISDIEIVGNDRDQQVLRFNMFQLRQNHPESDKLSISATGLSGNHYGGLVFWDTEMYMVPYFNYIDPKLVKSLLMYRYNILDKARERADQLDGRGALYSWMSISGEETNALPECSTAQHHINSDIAYAVWRYYISSGDREFLFDYGAEMLFETARYLVDRGKFIARRDDQFCINCVCGPDEYGCNVNNNCYTNMMVRFHLNFASRIYALMNMECPEILASLSEKITLNKNEPDLWQRAADRMYIPFNKELGIHEQDDSYLYRDPVDMQKFPRNFDIRYGFFPMNLWRMQITKQADVVLLMFVLGNEFSPEVKRANYEFYEPRTCHGSSLSPSVHSIIASEIGRETEAYEFFHQSLYMDVSDFRRNTHGGIHFAAAGGTWMAVVNGFAGMRDYEDRLIFNPRLPEQWRSFKFKIRYRGRLLEIEVQKEKTCFRLLSGEPLDFAVYGKQVRVETNLPVSISML